MGYCLVGVFMDDDFGVDHLGHIKGNMSLVQMLRRIATHPNMVSKNMADVASIIRYRIHSSPNGPLQIPQDLTHLLELLRNYTIDLSPLLRNHASHEDEDIESALLVKMHNRLKVIFEEDPTKHSAILQAITEASVWVGNAMQNTHLHRLLRYSKRKVTQTLDNVSYQLLITAVQYPEDANGLLTCRRNGQAHLEPDYSVDKIGCLEPVLFGSMEGLKMHHRLQHQQQQQHQQQHHHQQQQQQQQHQQQQQQQQHQHHQQQQQHHQQQQVSLESLQQQPGPQYLATLVSQTLNRMFTGTLVPQLSLAAAKAGAAEAANYIATHADPLNPAAYATVTKDAMAKALVKVNQTPQGVAQVPPPSVMFNAQDLARMYRVAAPRLVVELQRVMFDQGECFRLGNDIKMPQLT